MARVENGGNDLRVKSAGARLAEQFVSCLRRFQRCAMRAALSHRLERVRATQDASSDINVLAPTPTVVTRAVDPLVMHPGNACHRFQRRSRRKDALRMVGMQMHLFPFAGREWSGLRPYAIGDAYPTEVVEVRGDLETR